ncbi:hypothetical protein V5G24_22965 [Xanthobacter sp. VTT E-85241]|uniref:hypothetical protein n=1 Tax=Roseixanthobacter finlandensis TaxID=3119922 RepID=UPI0037285884
MADLIPGWRELMHSIYTDGGSDAEVKVALAIPPARAMSNELWDDLQAREPEFSQAVKEGRLIAEAWWAKAGQQGIFMGKTFNATTYIFNMHNRFLHWKNRQDVEHSGNKENPVRLEHAISSLTVDELRALASGGADK